MEVFKRAFSMFSYPAAKKYKNDVFDSIENIIVTDKCKNKFTILNRSVLMKYRSPYTTNYFYLASKLLGLSIFINHKDKDISEKDLYSLIQRKKSDFISLFPEEKKQAGSIMEEEV